MNARATDCISPLCMGYKTCVLTLDSGNMNSVLPTGVIQGFEPSAEAASVQGLLLSSSQESQPSHFDPGHSR